MGPKVQGVVIAVVHNPEGQAEDQKEVGNGNVDQENPHWVFLAVDEQENPES